VKDSGGGVIEHCQAPCDGPNPNCVSEVRRYFASPTPAAAGVETNQRNLKNLSWISTLALAHYCRSSVEISTKCL
jgi:hypothetical protein